MQRLKLGLYSYEVGIVKQQAKVNYFSSFSSILYPNFTMAKRQVPRSQAILTKPILVRYLGDSPKDGQIREVLGLRGENYTYIVATAAQARLRTDLVPAHQKSPGNEGSPIKKSLIFHQFLRLQLQINRVRLMSRAEERVALTRAARLVAEGNEQAARQLRHDVFAWRDAMADVFSRGVTFPGSLPEDLAEQLVDPQVGKLLIDLGTRFQSIQKQQRMRPFEREAFSFLQQRYQPTPIVVLEGFTFFTPLQKYFIKVCLQKGSKVFLVLPYAPSQQRGFAILPFTYGEFWCEEGAISLESDFEHCPTQLRHLKESLFAETPPALPTPLHGEHSVFFAGYRHRHREISAVLEHIQDYLDAGIDSKQIAIVSRNGGEFHTLLQEEAARRGLRDAKGQAVELGVPPRMLMLTPMGRFALALYQVWIEDALQMDPNHFESILASGWLGKAVQDTTESFTALRSQFFEHCRSAADWQTAFKKLGEVHKSLPAASRLPAARITQAILDLWQANLERIVVLCQQLFEGDEKSIGEHIARLIDVLGQLDTTLLRRSEAEVLRRIREALAALANASSMPIEATEFGEVLNSLVREYEQAEGEEEEQLERPRTIWVTTPEGIDGYQCEVVFYLGADNRRLPRAYSEPWPFYEVTTERHFHQERYLFLAVVRATGQALHISYAKSDADDVYRPSQYLHEACELLDLQIAEIADPGEDLLPEPIQVSANPTSRRDNYSLLELVHYGLCPYRYRLEHLAHGARHYRQPFQVALAAQAFWLNAILENLRQDQVVTHNQEELREVLELSMGATESMVVSVFPGLRPLQWVTIRRYVGRDIEELIKTWGNKQNPVAVISARTADFRVQIDGGRQVIVDATLRHAIAADYVDNYNRDLIREEFLLLTSRPDNQTPVTREVRGIELSYDRANAQNWWWNAALSSLKNKQTHHRYGNFHDRIRYLIQNIEGGNFPKHEGKHCVTCPVRGDCLGDAVDHGESQDG